MTNLNVIPIAHTKNSAELLAKLLSGLVEHPFEERKAICEQSLNLIRLHGANRYLELAVALILQEFLLHSVIRARVLYKEFNAHSDLENPLWEHLGGLLNVKKLRIKKLDSSITTEPKLFTLLLLISCLFSKKPEHEYLIKLAKSRMLNCSLMHILLAAIECHNGKNDDAAQHVTVACEIEQTGTLIESIACCFRHEYIDDSVDALVKKTNSQSLIGLFARMRQVLKVPMSEQAVVVRELVRSDIIPFQLLIDNCIVVCTNILLKEKNNDAIELITKYKLVPNRAPILIDNWPWPIKIYSMGRFGVYNMRGEDLSEKASCKKPFELLKVLISQGGRQVSSTLLMDLLWPEAEGDVASRSFSTTLHRLRKIIGKDSLILKNGMLSLDERFCWVDTWFLSRAIDDLSLELAQSRVQNLHHMVRKISTAYKGEFLSNSMDDWAIPFRNKLRNKVLQVLYSAKDHLASSDAKSALEYSIANVCHSYV